MRLSDSLQAPDKAGQEAFYCSLSDALKLWMLERKKEKKSLRSNFSTKLMFASLMRSSWQDSKFALKAFRL